MKKSLIIFSIIAVAAIGMLYSFTLQKQDMPDLKGWPEASQKAAKDMMDKYGKPDGITSDMLIWNNKGIWLKTIVYKKEMKHDFPKPHTDVMEQWINYSVPLDKYNDLAKYDGSVTANRTNGTISARCDKEAMNFLALNLSYDIIKGNKDVEQVRMEYGKSVMAFMKGEKPEYTQKLIFSSDKSAPDPDKPLEMMKDMKMGQK